MKICYFGSYDPFHPRNLVTITGLQRAGLSVFECNVYGHRKLLRYPLLVWRFLKNCARDTSCLLVSAGGYFYLPLAWLLARLTRKPLVFDAFYSLYDTIVTDRQWVSGHSVRAKLYKALDQLGCRLADAVVVDTEQHKEYFSRQFGVTCSKLYVVRVGADDQVFFPREVSRNGAVFTVLYVGKFIPLHGVEYIVQAANLLKGETDIRFLLVGDGQTRPDIERQISSLQLENVELHDEVDRYRYAELIAESDVCLGVFGESPKTQRVVPCKVYDALASGKPIITADTPAIRDLLSDKVNCILCPPGDARAVADAILLLRENEVLRHKIASNAADLFKQALTPDHIGEEWLGVFRTLSLTPSQERNYDPS